MKLLSKNDILLGEIDLEVKLEYSKEYTKMIFYYCKTSNGKLYYICHHKEGVVLTDFDGDDFNLLEENGIYLIGYPIYIKLPEEDHLIQFIAKVI